MADMIIMDFVNNRVIIQRVDGTVAPVDGHVMLASTSVPPVHPPRD